VQMIVLPESGESPLPRTNFRFGHPTPLRGVEVERKWKRPDYTEPGSQKLLQIRIKETKRFDLVKRDQSVLKGSAPWRVPYPSNYLTWTPGLL
jgi:hypothetical protein